MSSISVIIPAYNMEKYISRCLASVLDQSMADLDIIVVDDGSKDNTSKIVNEISKTDARVRLIKHKENMGLFRARLTGIEASKGGYITFVDADDKISFDWFRCLYNKIIEENADFVIGQYLIENEDGSRYFHNLDPLRQEVYLTGDEVLDKFMKQRNTHYSIHVIWNKIYKRGLWEIAFPDLIEFSKTNNKLTMCEDMAFSSALWSRAKKVCNITEGGYYYYCNHPGQSVRVSKNIEANTKKLQDVANVFSFMNRQLKSCKKDSLYEKDYITWKLFYAKNYYKLLKDANPDSEYLAEIQKYFSFTVGDEIEKFNEKENFFYTVETVFDNGLFAQYEQDLKAICSDEIKVVSFDIFDTLISRPFMFPSDLFCLLNDYVYKLTGAKSYFSFADIRIEAEKSCRKHIKQRNINSQDITLDEIYEQIGVDYFFSEDTLKLIKEKEIELELKFCTQKKSGKTLYDFAVAAKKKIIFCSDMYLSKDIVEKILNKNAFSCDKLFLSSETRLAKHTGDLYEFIAKELDVDGAHIIHFGDDYETDYNNAIKAGWKAGYVANAITLFNNFEQKAYSGEFYANLKSRNGKWNDTKNAEQEFLGYRCAMAVVANKLNSNPYKTISRESDFNCDPYSVGYFAVGQYLFAVVNWIIQNVKDKGIGTVHFVAGNGYLPMLAYDLFKQNDNSLPKANYLYISRKAMLVSDIYQECDLYSIINKLNIFAYSPYKLVKLFKAYCDENIDSLLKKELGLSDKLYRTKFKERADYERCLKAIAPLINYNKLAEYRHGLKEYFSEIIKPNDIIFDIGYSGRAESSLSKLLGYSVNSLYIHINSHIADYRAEYDNFNNACFYDTKPVITGVVREHIFMKLAPSVVGYKNNNGTLEPEFEEYKENNHCEIITNILQGAAIDYVIDIISIFGEYLPQLKYRKNDLAFSFEQFLHYAKPFDRKMFGVVFFEDDFGLGEELCALDYWNTEIQDLYSEIVPIIENVSQRERLKAALAPYGKIKKALAYGLLDKKFLLKKLKNFLSKKKR